MNFDGIDKLVMISNRLGMIALASSIRVGSDCRDVKLIMKAFDDQVAAMNAHSKVVYMKREMAKRIVELEGRIPDELSCLLDPLDMDTEIKIIQAERERLSEMYVQVIDNPRYGVPVNDFGHDDLLTDEQIESVEIIVC